jgi:hypothetical protein
MKNSQNIPEEAKNERPRKILSKLFRNVPMLTYQRMSPFVG